MSGLVLKTKSLRQDCIFKLDTREFGKEARYDCEKFVPDETYYYQRYYRNAYTHCTDGYGSTTSSISDPCPLCGKDTYSTTGICWTCNHNTTIEALCEKCGLYKPTIGMVSKEDGTVCKDCQESVHLLPENCNVYDFCDGCAESFPKSMITEFGLYSLCVDCKGDDDICMVVNGGYSA